MAMEMMYYSMAALNGNLSDQLQAQLGYHQMQNGDQKGFQPSYKRMAQRESLPCLVAKKVQQSLLNIKPRSR